jgi:hypothetical protein
VQPAGIYVHVVQRGLAPGGPGPGLRRGRRRFLRLLPLWFYAFTRNTNMFQFHILAFSQNKFTNSRWGISKKFSAHDLLTLGSVH